jgi:hypothetical protein
MKETIKKLSTGHVEIRTTVEHDEVVTYKPEILAQDVENAEKVVAQRESELATAVKNLSNLKSLKNKVDKAK